jgi:hypothetical protein
MPHKDTITRISQIIEEIKSTKEESVISGRMAELNREIMRIRLNDSHSNVTLMKMANDLTQLYKSEKEFIKLNPKPGAKHDASFFRALDIIEKDLLSVLRSQP